VIASKANILKQSVNNYVTQASDVFDGTNAVNAGQTGQIDTLLGGVTDDTESYQDTAVDESPTPAGCADSWAAADETLAACIALSDAIKAASPPIIEYVVPVRMDLLKLCQQRYKQDAARHAQEIMTINRIPNPAAIPAGTVLKIPSI
jgi:hypothetical protein